MPVAAGASPSRIRSLAVRGHTVVVAALVAAAVEFAARSGFDVQAPAPMVVAVLYATFLGGVVPGALSCLLAVAYVGYALAPAGDLLALSGAALSRFVGFAVAAPLIVVMVGLLRRRGERRLRQVADSLRVEKQQYEHVFDALDKLGLGVALADAESHRFVHVNEAVCCLTGYSRSELLELPSLFALVPPEEVAARRARFRQAAAEGDVAAAREMTTLRRKDGAVVHVEVGARVVARNPLEVLVLVRDVEDQVALAERLARSEALLRDAERIAAFGAWDWDLRADRVEWSDGMFRLYGYEPRSFAVTFRKAMERVHPDDEPVVEGRLGELRERAKREPGAELRVDGNSYRIVLPSGEVRRLLASTVAASDAHGDLTRLVGTIRLVAASPPEAPAQKARRSRREASLRGP